jgi:hypothetical protein
MLFKKLLEDYERERLEHRPSQFGDVWSFLTWRDVGGLIWNSDRVSVLIDLSGDLSGVTFALVTS